MHGTARLAIARLRARRLFLTLAAGTLVTAFPVVMARKAAADAAPATVSYYVAVGDSLAAGYAAPTGSGYADDLLARWRAQQPGLTLQNFGCANETTATMMRGGYCTYPQGPQLAAAEAFLRAHRGQVSIVTIDIGGNDVVGCGENGLDIACLQNSLNTVGANLRVILGGLRDAAGPNVPIVGMNYFDPFLTDWLQGASGQSFAQATVPLDDQVSALLAQAYAVFGVPVADVEGAFATHDFTTMVSRAYGTVPVNVANVCDWLDATCHATTGAEFLGVDANATGYRVIADAFAAAAPTLGPVVARIDTGGVPAITASPTSAGSGSRDATASSGQAAATQLPMTGGGQALVALGALIAIVAGVTLVRTSRRRADRSPPTPEVAERAVDR